MAEPKDPKAQAKGEPQADVQIVNDDEAKTGGDEITVDISRPKQSDTVQTSGKDYDEELKKLRNRMEYQARQFEKGIRQVNEALQTLSTTRSVQNQKPASDGDTDDVDRIAEQDWKKAVKILSAEEAKQKIEEYERSKRAEEEKLKVQNELDRSKARVMERYPQLEDENSDEAQTYVQVLNENPNLLTNPYGPELAMYKMEERLKRKPAKDDVDLEVQRRARVASVYTPQGRLTGNSSRVVLTKSEQQYCDSHNIPYDQFAKMKAYDPARLKEGVEVE